MAIIRVDKQPGLKLTERSIQKKVFFAWPDGYTSFPNVNLFGWEMDLAMVSSSDYLTEIEVKITLSDWKADCKKDKFLNIEHYPKRFKYIKYFYYAVPEKLLTKIPAFVSEDTGIISICKDSGIEIIRQAVARKGCEKLTSRLVAQLYSKFYWRYRWWDSKWDSKQPDQSNFLIYEK